MNVLLAIDESACSAMAVETVARQFSPATTEIRLTGSVAEHLLRHAPCAVEIVRPALAQV